MPKIHVEITEKELRAILHDYLIRSVGRAFSNGDSNIDIMVKSKQNYKSEWERADFKAIVDIDIPFVEE